MYREPITITIAIVCLIGLIGYGCGNDTPEPNELPARLIDSEPANGEHIVMIHYHAKITLFFDRKPQRVTILRQPAKITGTKAVWFGSIRELVVPNTTQIVLPIEWVNPDGTTGEGAKIPLYWKANDAIGPRVVDSNLDDLDDGEESHKNLDHKNLDPDVLNREGIVLECNETIVTTDLVLALVGSIRESSPLGRGESFAKSIPLNWTRTVEDKTVRFERGSGSPLQFNKTYIIRGDLRDEFENATVMAIIFTTRLAPATKQ